MADEENNEPKKRGGLVKILLFAFGGIALIGIGLGVGFVLFGSTQPDPSEEIEQMPNDLMYFHYLLPKPVHLIL